MPPEARLTRAWRFARALVVGSGAVFQLLLRYVRGVPPELLGFAGTGLVFLIFAYPVRKLVIFKLPADLVEPAPPS